MHVAERVPTDEAKKLNVCPHLDRILLKQVPIRVNTINPKVIERTAPSLRHCHALANVCIQYIRTSSPWFVVRSGNFAQIPEEHEAGLEAGALKMRASC